MKTITRLLGLLALCTTVNAHAQIINMNPDPEGKPWLSGDAVTPPPEAWNDALEFIPSAASLASQLPSSVYNDQNIWFPYIFDQEDNACCVHVAELFYTFTYELNRKRNKEAGDGINDLTNLYHPLYTYNFLNEGDSTTYTYFKSGFDIIKQNGCASLNNPD